MNEITIVTLEGQEIQLYSRKGEIGYSMKINDKDYGVRVPLKSKKLIDIVTATSLLLSNALDTKKALNENNRIT